MKLGNKVFYSLLILLISTNLVAGIAKTSVAQKIEDIKNNTPYAGEKNFLGDDAHKYIGETLYLKGKSPGWEREYGYMYFFSNFSSKTKYKQNSNYNTDYDAVAEKDFIVLDVIKNPNNKEYNTTWGTIYYLKLKETTSGDILYYRYDSSAEASFPFIVIKFYETQKN